MVGTKWSAADIERGLRVRMQDGHKVATVYQASWKRDDLDQWTLVYEAKSVFHPEVRNAAQMAAFLTKEGFVRVGLSGR